MPERWQLELKRLRELQMPPSIRGQIERGPTGDRLPPRRDRLLAGVVAFTVFVAAGMLVWTAFRPTRSTVGGGGSPQVEVAFDDTGVFPTALLTFDGQTVEGVPGSNCWTTGDTTRCADMVEPHFTNFLAVPRGSELVVEGSADGVEGSLGAPEPPFATMVTLDLGSGSTTLDADAGRYVLSLIAHWPQGDVPFDFAIEIVGGFTPTPTGAVDVVLHVVCAPDGTTSVATPVVLTHPDGLHVLVDDRAGSDAVLVRQPGRPEWGWSSGSNGLDDEFVMLVPPGDSYVRCMEETSSPTRAPQGPSAAPGEAAFTVVDAGGNWVSIDLACPAGAQESFSKQGGLDAGETREEAVRRYVSGILSSDVVEAAGYVASPNQREAVRIVRSGGIVAWLFAHNPTGSWSFDGYACSGTGIGA